MSSSFDFTDKTQETLAAAIQLAKDYASAHGIYFNYVTEASCLITPPQQLCPLISRSFS